MKPVSYSGLNVIAQKKATGYKIRIAPLIISKIRSMIILIINDKDCQSLGQICTRAMQEDSIRYADKGGNTMGKRKIDWTEASGRDARILEHGPDGCMALLGAGGGGISLPQIIGSRERYLFGDVEVLEEHSMAMMFRCFLPDEETERIYMRFGILPRFKIRICLDLELLDNRTIFTNRTPGTLKLVVHGQRTKREDVGRFERHVG